MHKPISSFGLATKIRNLKIQNKHKKRTKSFDQKNPNIVQSKKTCLYAVGKPMEKRFKKIKNFALTYSTQNDTKPKNVPNYDFFPPSTLNTEVEPSLSIPLENRKRPLIF